PKPSVKCQGSLGSQVPELGRIHQYLLDLTLLLKPFDPFFDKARSKDIIAGRGVVEVQEYLAEIGRLKAHSHRHLPAKSIVDLVLSRDFGTKLGSILAMEISPKSRNEIPLSRRIPLVLGKKVARIEAVHIIIAGCLYSFDQITSACGDQLLVCQLMVNLQLRPVIELPEILRFHQLPVFLECSGRLGIKDGRHSPQGKSPILGRLESQGRIDIQILSFSKHIR